jgi:death-on-curing protein
MSRKKKKNYNYIRPEEIISFHEMVIERHGGIAGVPQESYGRAESVIAQQHYAELRYKTAESKAAYLIYLITKGHIFPDGNKRTGILSGMVFLNINGFKIETKHEDIERFATWVADSDPHKKDFVINYMSRWIGARLKRTRKDKITPAYNLKLSLNV